MGRHSRGSGEPPAPLPDPPARHPYAPRPVEETGDRDPRAYRVVDVGMPAGAPGASEPPRYGGPAAAPRHGHSAARADPPPSNPRGHPAQDAGGPRFGATRSDPAASRPAAPAVDPAGSGLSGFRAPVETRFGTGEPRYGPPWSDPADPRFGGSPVAGSRLHAPAADLREPRFGEPGSGGSRLGADESRLVPPPADPSGPRLAPIGGHPPAQPRFGATRADLIDPRGGRREERPESRFGAAESRLPPPAEPRFGATRADLAESQRGRRDDPESRFGATRVDLVEPQPGGRDDPESRFGATRADLVEPQRGRRDDPAGSRFGATRVDLVEPQPGGRDAPASSRVGATRVDLAESVGSTALAPRPVTDPDEVTDTGARRARSAFRLATEDDEAERDQAEHDGPQDLAEHDGPQDEQDGHEHEHEPALLLQWVVFVVQTLTGAVAGLGIWLGFYRLWSTWPFYAAPAVGVAAVAMLVLARALRRRHGRDLDLLTAVVTAGVITVLTVLPAAFTLQGLAQ